MDSRKGTVGPRGWRRQRRWRGRGRRVVRRVCPRSKAAHAGSPWITALIESLSDVPWSRVILLPKQLLSSVVYSHLFHPAEPERRTLPFSSSSRVPIYLLTHPLTHPPTLHTPLGFRHLRSRTISRLWLLCTLMAPTTGIPRVSRNSRPTMAFGFIDDDDDEGGGPSIDFTPILSSSE